MSVIPSQLNPIHIEYLKAKSEKNGGDTLAEHTWQVLCRLKDQYRLRPHLAEQIGDERLWQRLYWACFLHDFGKAAAGFQDRLKESPPENEWIRGQHRHEVLSLAFIDWLFPAGHPDRLPVVCTIASHHKDIGSVDYNPVAIFTKYGCGLPSQQAEYKRIEFLVSQLTEKVVSDLWVWLEQYGLVWQEHFDLPGEALHPANFESFGAAVVHEALADCRRHLLTYEDGIISDGSLTRDMLYRGLILTADHAASANSPEFPPMPLTDAIAEKPLQGHTKRYHQVQMQTVPAGSALMIAPTGSGKTEAAFLWAVRQMVDQPAARLFYTLPYQASMNAMAERLAQRYFDIHDLTHEDNQVVTIQHSRARLKFYQMLMDAEDADSKLASKDAKWLQNLARLNYFPIQVFSPYQMLKAAYSLKGYEALLVDYANALFIFDEIHAYEPKRLALIITFMGWLARKYGARFLIMTATLPSTVKQALQDALPELADPQHIVEADADLFIESQRHEVHIHDGELLQHLDGMIADDINAGKTVLVCCNRVARAQDVYRYLKSSLELIPDKEIVLLHGRFSNGDRGAKEALLGVVRSGQEAERRLKRFVLVATQAVEVSLDIDLDVLYTDPAPLEALLQRFGRVNRGRKNKVLCPVNVFREPDTPEEGKEPLYLPYDGAMVERSIEVLAQFCGGEKPVDEALVTDMLEEIYKDEIAENWWKDYNDVARSFESTILGTMKPFQSATRDMWEQFQKLFDGVEVLPTENYDDYLDAVENANYLDASRYLVNISHSKLRQLYNKGLVLPREPDAYVDQIKVPYDPEWGLALDEALRGETPDE